MYELITDGEKRVCVGGERMGAAPVANTAGFSKAAFALASQPRILNVSWQWLVGTAVPCGLMSKQYVCGQGEVHG